MRGNHRQDIFFRPEDRTLFCELLADAVERFGARLHAYCLMTNHFHLLAQVAEAPLGQLMQCVTSRYARTIHRRYRTGGHLFQRRYHAVLVDADEYLLELVRYIHLNPLRASMVTDITDYPWSSHHVYIGSVEQPWVTTDFVLRMFHAERSTAVAAYRSFVEDRDAVTVASPLTECNPYDRRVLGDDQFLASIASNTWTPQSRKTLDELIEHACLQFGVTNAELQSPSRRRQLTKARAWVAHQAAALQVTSVAHVARVFGRDESSLRQSVAVHFAD
jgi:REP element-mobilizing transposase RayT